MWQRKCYALCLVAMGIVAMNGCVSKNKDRVSSENETEIELAALAIEDTENDDLGDVESETTKAHENNSVGQWKFGYYTDEFGDELKDEPYIFMSLKAHVANKPHDDEWISLGYSKNREAEYFVFHSNELIYRISPGENSGPSVSIKKDGEIQELEITKAKGYAYCFDEWERRYIADLLEEGNFTLKVGNRLVEITNETKYIKNALKLLGDVEILEPVITREDPVE